MLWYILMYVWAGITVFSVMLADNKRSPPGEKMGMLLFCVFLWPIVPLAIVILD